MTHIHTNADLNVREIQGGATKFIHPLQTCTHGVNTTSESFARFDLLSAVMSLVVKLLLNFNIVYRQWHLPTEILIYPFLRRTGWPLYTTSVYSSVTGFPCRIFAKNLCLSNTCTDLVDLKNPVEFHRRWGKKQSVYGENRIWIIHVPNDGRR